jgi:hypothetical protein
VDGTRFGVNVDARVRLENMVKIGTGAELGFRTGLGSDTEGAEADRRPPVTNGEVTIELGIVDGVEKRDVGAGVGTNVNVGVAECVPVNGMFMKPWFKGVACDKVGAKEVRKEVGVEVRKEVGIEVGTEVGVEVRKEVGTEGTSSGKVDNVTVGSGIGVGITARGGGVNLGSNEEDSPGLGPAVGDDSPVLRPVIRASFSFSASAFCWSEGSIDWIKAIDSEGM